MVKFSAPPEPFPPSGAWVGLSRGDQCGASGQCTRFIQNCLPPTFSSSSPTTSSSPSSSPLQCTGDPQQPRSVSCPTCYAFPPMVINVVSAAEIIEMKLVSSFGSSKQTDNLLLLLCQHELVLKLVSPVSSLFKCLFSESLFWNKQTGELLLEIGPLWSFSWSQFHLAGSHILWIFNAFLLHRVEVQTDFTNCNSIWWPMWQFLRCLHREAAITQLCVHIVNWWKYNAVNVSSYQRQQTEDWGLQTLQLLSQDTSHWNLFDCLLRAVCWPSGQLESVQLGFRWVRLWSLVRKTRW